MKLSNFETEVMGIIWELGECSAPQVHQHVSQSKSVTYSTVKTIVDRLEQKGALSRTRSQGRTIFFQAKILPESIQPTVVERLVNTLFAGDRKPLFAQLLDSDELSKDDLDYLQKLVAAKQKDKR